MTYPTLTDFIFDLTVQEEDNITPSSPISSETWEIWIKTWLSSLSEYLPEGDHFELSLLLTNDLGIRSYNAQYRQQNKSTDVLSFASLEADIPYSDDYASEDAIYLGDLIISLETAERQALQHEHSLSIELAWLASHGLLHLLGWDHPDEASLQEMLADQETLLAQIGLTVSEKYYQA